MEVDNARGKNRGRRGGKGRGSNDGNRGGPRFRNPLALAINATLADRDRDKSASNGTSSSLLKKNKSAFGSATTEISLDDGKITQNNERSVRRKNNSGVRTRNEGAILRERKWYDDRRREQRVANRGGRRVWIGSRSRSRSRNRSRSRERYLNGRRSRSRSMKVEVVMNYRPARQNQWGRKNRGSESYRDTRVNEDRRFEISLDRDNYDMAGRNHGRNIMSSSSQGWNRDKVNRQQHEYNLDEWGRRNPQDRGNDRGGGGEIKWFRNHNDRSGDRGGGDGGGSMSLSSDRSIESHRGSSQLNDDNSYHSYDQDMHVNAPSSPVADRRSGASSEDHDDTVGHYQGTGGDIIAKRYKLVKKIGLGTFGKVFQCVDTKDRDHSNVAIKVVRNVKRYIESAKIEADILQDVNTSKDPLNQRRGVELFSEMYSSFAFQGHYCLVFECLGKSLYEYIKKTDYCPLDLEETRHISMQLLSALDYLHSMTPNPLIHTDLKLENILLVNDEERTDNTDRYRKSVLKSTKIKVIDFGGATYENERKSSIINTRQYRAPEVILQHENTWSTPSDMWSAACIIMELHQGELLFATHDNVEHLALIEKVCAPFNTKFLKQCRDYELIDEVFDPRDGRVRYSQLSSNHLKHVKSVGNLRDVVYSSYHSKRGASEQALHDLLKLVESLLKVDPRDRVSANEALNSSFISR
eukprot:CAMPEP_0116058780 /NCGR_PEP_ID=MMETSP0322-20121206/5408_1 /TAXON_ID=163516 /ORGANISM="Leptocylindrus danicus var. apora, Strain B651" /LENGTH=694 /DNA_ID=CAMNT_0003543043 /DNA_START=57 /DNA_END=2141 /DNA_ORIENTATION=-